MNHDYLADKAANYKLLQDIKAWWAKRGFAVKAWIESAKDPTSGSTIHVIRTNITQNCGDARTAYAVD